MTPKIVCHMISSVDGRLLVDRYSPLYSKTAPSNYSTDLYLKNTREIKADAWIVGKASVKELAFPKVLDFSKEPATTNFKTHIAETDLQNPVVIFDSKGTIDFTENTIMTSKIIVALGETVSDKYLQYLKDKKISYLFAGKDGKDFKLAVEILQKEFKINSLVLAGGGTINGAFLKAGLIDELLLQLYPGIDGLAGIPSIFEYQGGKDELPSKGQQLELIDIKKEEHGIVYLRYKFHKQ